MATAAPDKNIDLGRVLGRTSEAIKANFVAYLALAVLLIGVPTFITQYLTVTSMEAATAYIQSSPERVQPSDLLAFFRPAFWGPIVGALLVTLLGYLLLQLMLTRSTILQLSGRDPDIGGSFALGLRLAVPAFILGLFVGVMMVIGFILLIVPGVMVWCAFVVVMPVLVQERVGIFMSMTRSRDLTRGSRWWIFLLGVLLWVFSIIISSATGVIGGIGTTYDGVMPVQNPIISGLASGIGSAITGLITNVVIAALYVELREVKEGASTTELASVFD